jgi:HEPN domain-containing protein
VSSISGADPDSALAWFQVALGDLVAAQVLAAHGGLTSRAAAALAQQAAEKAIKAAIAFAGTDPPRTHDLVALAAGLRAHGLSIPESVDLAELTDGLRTGRYPDPDEPSPGTSAVADLVASSRTITEIVRGHLEANGVDLNGAIEEADLEQLPLPPEWQTLPDGSPMPNVVRAVRQSEPVIDRRR